MAVRHLQARVLSLILRSPSRLPAASHAPQHRLLLHRLVSSSAAASSSVAFPRPFAAEDYLVSRCGLTQAQALKAAAKISHLPSRAKPDAVLAFLEALGIPAAGVTRVVLMDPSFLCADVEQTLERRVADLRELGLSRDEIALLVPLAPNSFRNRFLRSNLEFWLTELGSLDNLLLLLRLNSGLLSVDLDKVARPNVAFLRECGLNVSEIAGINMYSTRLFNMNPEVLKDTVQRVEELGVKRGMRMFRRALSLVAVTNKEALARRLQLLRNTGFSEDDVLEIVRKAPLILGLSEQKIQGNVDFLMKDVGLDVPYIARRPVLMLYSVERRLLPRHWLLNVLWENGLLKGELDYYVTASMAEKNFVQKFVDPLKNHVPSFANDYASKCLGKAMDGSSVQMSETGVAEACAGKKTSKLYRMK